MDILNNDFSNIVNILDDSGCQYETFNNDKGQPCIKANLSCLPWRVTKKFKDGEVYNKYLVSFNPDTFIAELVFDSVDKNESVMNPTPTPYEYEPVLLPKELELDESFDEDDDVSELVKSVIRDVNKEIKDYDSDRYVDTITKKLKDKGLSVDDDLLGQSIVDVMNEDKKVSFKDAHICNGCGKSLSQCTCEVEDEEFVDESFSSSSATQSSSVGSHKKFSIDLIPKDECEVTEDE